MIAFADNLPLVQFESGEVAVFRRDWLLRSLAHAALRAGYPKWWLAEHVAESVTSYLTLRFEENVVALPRLATAVQSVLQVIGYAEIAAHFVPGPPLARISLVQIAEDAGAGYELAFFDLLARTVTAEIEGSANYIELVGLDRAVRQLRARKTWNRNCDALRDDIVTFLRDKIAGCKRRADVTLSIC